MTILLYITDLHGRTEAYESAFREAAKKGIDALILGGDLCPTGFNEIFIPVQREFLAGYLIPRTEKFRQDTGKPVFVMMGNDDFKANEPLLLAAQKKGTLLVTNLQRHCFQGWTIIGYSYINETPFLLKDWEKTEKEMKKDLDKLGRGCDMGRTIVQLHAPPKGTKLDMLYDGSHVGSTAIRQFIEEQQPALTLHGHIHESPDISGSLTDTIGRTVCLNPGNTKMMQISLGSPITVARVR